MGKHSKNAGGKGAEAPTYAERQMFGYGTHRERLGKDALLPFDHCSLTLSPLEDPVCTPEGVLYSRAAILENLLNQKRRLKRKATQEDAKKKEELVAKAAEEEAHAAKRLKRFEQTNFGGGGATNDDDGGGADKPSKLAGIFWLPSQAPDQSDERKTEAAASKKETTTCPITGKKLRLKDLIDVRFTRVPESQQEEVQQFMCPVSRDIFGPTSKLVLLRPTGDVLLESSYNTAVKPEASYRGVPIQETDVITLKAGRNTGFAHANNVEASKSYMVGRGSGLADLRGQGGSAPSRFALSM